MMRKSSIHIQKASIFSFFHNSREAAVDYLIDSSVNNTCNRKGIEAYYHYLSLYVEAITNYSNRTKQSIQVKSEKLLWEAVINLESYHTIADVERVTEYLEKFGWQIIQSSLHRDEGYRDELTQKIIYNFHAHIMFMPLSKQGLYCFKKNAYGRKRMSQLQTHVARLLGMERGKSKRETKKVSLDHAQYRQTAQEKEELEFEIKRLNADVETFED